MSTSEDELEFGEAIEEVLRLAERMRMRAHRASRAQFLAGKQARRIHFLVGVPNTVLTALVGTAIVASLGEEHGDSAVLGVGLLAALAAVLAAVQTFLGYGEMSIHHRAAGARLGALRRDLDVFVLEVRSGAVRTVDAIVALRDLTSRFNQEEESALDVADRWYDRARREQRADEEGV